MRGLPCSTGCSTIPPPRSPRPCCPTPVWSPTSSSRVPLQISAKVHRFCVTAMGTGHVSQAAVADLAAVDCKTGVPSSCSLDHLIICLCLLYCLIETCHTPLYAGLVHAQLVCISTCAIFCLALQVIVLLVVSVLTILRLQGDNRSCTLGT
jgi:hypothetical protein